MTNFKKFQENILEHLKATTQHIRDTGPCKMIYLIHNIIDVGLRCGGNLYFSVLHEIVEPSFSE